LFTTCFYNSWKRVEKREKNAFSFTFVTQVPHDLCICGLTVCTKAIAVSAVVTQVPLDLCICYMVSLLKSHCHRCSSYTGVSRFVVKVGIGRKKAEKTRIFRDSQEILKKLLKQRAEHISTTDVETMLKNVKKTPILKSYSNNLHSSCSQHVFMIHGNMLKNAKKMRFLRVCYTGASRFVHLSLCQFAQKPLPLLQLLHRCLTICAFATLPVCTKAIAVSAFVTQVPRDLCICHFASLHKSHCHCCSCYTGASRFVHLRFGSLRKSHCHCCSCYTGVSRFVHLPFCQFAQKPLPFPRLLHRCLAICAFDTLPVCTKAIAVSTFVTQVPLDLCICHFASLHKSHCCFRVCYTGVSRIVVKVGIGRKKQEFSEILKRFLQNC